MADVFISYSRADQAQAEKLAAALGAAGLSVWWDRHIDSGAEFSAAIERELEAAKAVVVCWSKDGVKSHWVKDEASIAARSGKLKAISFDGTPPPIGFMQFHALDLSAWKAGRDDSAVSALTDLLQGRDAVQPENGNAEPAARPCGEGVSLIVLPFSVISADPADNVLAMAIHEDLTTQLARVRDYFVVSRSSSMGYRDKA